ncbi:MAG: tetratricopeptide repeat protein [Leptolyngbya sp. IPPAS B-1204]
MNSLYRVVTSLGIGIVLTGIATPLLAPSPSLAQSASPSTPAASTRSTTPLDPATAEKAYKTGRTQLKRQEYREALASFDLAIRANPNDARPYLQRGITYAALGDYSAALQDYNRAIELAPELVDAYLYRGIVHYKLGTTLKRWPTWTRC